jgi:putative FmdB family regulatory protein
VKAHCHKRDGGFGFVYLKSEHAVIELERKPQERSHGGGRAAAAWPPPPLLGHWPAGGYRRAEPGSAARLTPLSARGSPGPCSEHCALRPRTLSDVPVTENHRSMTRTLGAMPIYEYVCMQCESHFEELVRNGAQPDCPKCGTADVRKQLSVFSAHGSSTQTSIGTAPAPRSGGCCGGSCGCG